MINVVALVRAKPGEAERVRSALEKLIEPTQAETANQLYILHASTTDPNLFVFYETWASRAAFDEHLLTPHLRAFGAEVGDMLAAPLELHVLEAIAGQRVP